MRKHCRLELRLGPLNTSRRDKEQSGKQLRTLIDYAVGPMQWYSDPSYLLPDPVMGWFFL